MDEIKRWEECVWVRAGVGVPVIVGGARWWERAGVGVLVGGLGEGGSV